MRPFNRFSGRRAGGKTAVALVAVVGLALAATQVAAQSSSQSGSPPGSAPEQNAPSKFDSTAKNGSTNLSEHLGKTGGVIKPPAGVDPEIHEKAPATGDQEMVVPPQPNGAAPGKPAATPK